MEAHATEQLSTHNQDPEALCVVRVTLARAVIARSRPISVTLSRRSEK